MKKLVLGVILIVLASEIYAQSFYNYRRGRDFIASLGTGTSTYFGDLNDDGDYFDAKPNLNIGLQYFFTNRIAARAELGWFQLSGDDANSSESGKVNRNLSFSSNNFEFNVVGIVQAWPDGARYYQRNDFNIYGFAGVGVLYFNPVAELNGKKVPLQPLQTEGVSYSRVTIVIPYGIGIKYKL
ncbi:MAG: outer membrane beta-barrel protein, partial [Fulvivirga sp.]|uniref:outer membrane beta-barrel protein n=1 Tax=Fulvivirga sp. TaxID=1931237 RepID=UPI0032EF8BDA